MLQYIDRETKQIFTEKVYGEKALKKVYLSRFKLLIFPLLPIVSSLYGWWQKQKWTHKKVVPFITEYAVNDKEFIENTFKSFNDFFIRKLRPDVRPLSSSQVIMPADARYRFFSPLSLDERFSVKGKIFDLDRFLGRSGANFVGGTLVFARLCPVDYHRFHFPCDGTPGLPIVINGGLQSVNPLALAQNLSILWENRRILIPIESPTMGLIYCVAIGATNVGSIIPTYTPGKFHQKGDEMGYFSFGGSALAMLFPPNSLRLAVDLPVRSDLECFCKMGSSLSEEQIGQSSSL